MNRLRKKWIALFLVITLFAGMVMPVSAAASDAENYGKLLDSYTKNSSTFTVSDNSRLFVVGNSAPTGELLQTVQLISREFAAKIINSSTAMEIVWGPESYAKDGDILVKENSSLATEAYGLAVTTKAIITYKDVDGLLYGANSLMKFFMADGDKSLVGFTAADAPDTKERTVMLDTGRKYYTVEWICNFIKQMSWMGYNSIQVHVSEDGGFRADFWDPTYYKGAFQPENDFTWLCGSHVQSWVEGSYRDDPNAGYYLTTAELVKICEVAKEYHINIIPSFDSPAHMDYITWKFEQNYKNNKSYSFTYNGNTYEASSTKGCINYTGTTGASSPTWPNYTTIDITDGTMAKAFVFALYEDMADFFKEYAGSTDFSIGADEVNLTSYASSYPRTWGYSKFPGYINELNRMLRAKGYTCRMFNDFIGSTTYNQSSSATAVYDFDDNIEIMYWNSDFNPTNKTYGGDENKTWHVAFFWHDGTAHSEVSSSFPTNGWGDGGRTLYNCIQTNCYYVLRIGTSGTTSTRDARNPDNRNWTFYHSDEQHIYDEWYPADISEKGVYTENAADVPEEHLGGAYFLIWNDYAALNTEAEVWNGAVDSMGAGKTYYLFDRMYSNIIKMWNSDINSTVSYSDYASVRDKFGYFPGFTSCSAAASLPAAETPTKAYLADHSALDAALKKEKISNTELLYTTESYNAYETAYNNAINVNAKHDATAAEITAAINALTTAESNLEVRDLTVYYKLLNNTELESQTYDTDANGDYSISINFSSIAALEGYKIDSITVNNGSSTIGSDGLTADITGNIKNNNIHAVVWCVKDSLSLEALQTLLDEEITDGTIYTTDSWAAYTTALANAKETLTGAESTPDDYTQAQIDACVTALANAKAALRENGAEPETNIESIIKLTPTSRRNRPIGILVKTTADVNNITVTLKESSVALSNLTNGKAVLDDKGTVGKLWLVKFYAPSTDGRHTYTVSATTSEGVAVEKTVEVTVR